jgi:hypothetical protein
MRSITANHLTSPMMPYIFYPRRYLLINKTVSILRSCLDSMNLKKELTRRRRILLEKLTGAQLIKVFSSILWKSRLYFSLLNSPTRVRSGPTCLVHTCPISFHHIKQCVEPYNKPRVVELKSLFQFIRLGRNLGTCNIVKSRLHNASKFPAIHTTRG